MPLFFLNVVYNDGSTLADEDGAEFPDAAAALQEARRALKELLCETIALEREVVATSVHVVDEEGIDRGVVSIGSVVPDCVHAALRGSESP